MQKRCASSLYKTRRRKEESLLERWRTVVSFLKSMVRVVSRSQTLSPQGAYLLEIISARLNIISNR